MTIPNGRCHESSFRHDLFQWQLQIGDVMNDHFVMTFINDNSKLKLQIGEKKNVWKKESHNNQRHKVWLNEVI